MRTELEISAQLSASRDALTSPRPGQTQPSNETPCHVFTELYNRYNRQAEAYLNRVNLMYQRGLEMYEQGLASYEQMVNMTAEMSRSSSECTQLLASPVYHGVDVPPGNGQRILLITGLGGSAEDMMLMNGWMQRIGYRPERVQVGKSTGGRNTPKEENLEQAEKQLIGLSHKQDIDPYARDHGVIVVGHSLGGIFGRILAAKHPDKVSQIITLGSPHSSTGNTREKPVTEIARSFMRDDQHPNGNTLGRIMNSPEEHRHLLTIAPDIAVTSIWTPNDLVVNPEDCIDPNPRARNIRVNGSHIGLAHNPQVYQHLAKLLVSQQENA